MLSASDLARVRASAAVYAAPARYEPFGLGVLEAARDGCALVLGDIPSLRENWEGAGVFVDPADEERLGHELRCLLGDRERRGRLGGLARERSGRYTAAAMADGYLRLYREMTLGRVAAAA